MYKLPNARKLAWEHRWGPELDNLLGFQQPNREEIGVFQAEATTGILLPPDYLSPWRMGWDEDLKNPLGFQRPDSVNILWRDSPDTIPQKYKPFVSITNTHAPGRSRQNKAIRNNTYKRSRPCSSTFNAAATADSNASSSSDHFITCTWAKRRKTSHAYNGGTARPGAQDVDSAIRDPASEAAAVHDGKSRPALDASSIDAAFRENAPLDSEITLRREKGTQGVSKRVPFASITNSDRSLKLATAADFALSSSAWDDLVARTRSGESKKRRKKRHAGISGDVAPTEQPDDNLGMRDSAYEAAAVHHPGVDTSSKSALSTANPQYSSTSSPKRCGTVGRSFGNSADLTRSSVNEQPNSSQPRASQRIIAFQPLERYLAQKAIMLMEDQATGLHAARTGNIIVLGQPKSGKTTLTEAIAVVHASADSRALLLVRNKRTAEDVMARLGRAKVHAHVDVFSPVGLLNCLYPGHPELSEEDALNRLRKAPGLPTLRAYGQILIDEFQDWMDSLYWLLYTLMTGLTRMGPTPRLVLCGDSLQAVAGYRGGDTRFLERASTLFPSTPYAWKTVTLRDNHRISHPMARFVNKIYAGGKGKPDLQGSCHGPRPILLHVYPGEFYVKSAAEALLSLVKMHQYSCVLTAPSVTVQTVAWADLLRIFANHLSVLGIRVREPSDENMPLGAEDFAGQVAVVSYNQLQGTEFELVIVFGAESLPDGLIVAETRGRHLVLVYSADYPAPRNLSWDRLSHYADVKRFPPWAPPIQPTRKIYPSHIPSRLAISDIPRNIFTVSLDELLAKHSKHGLTIQEVAPRGTRLLPPHNIYADRTDLQDLHYVSVSDFNGLLVTTGLEWYLKTAALRDPCPDDMRIPIWDLTKAVIAQQAQRSGYIQRETALNDHSCDWLAHILPAAIERLRTAVAEFLPGNQLQFEAQLADYTRFIDGHPVTIQGCADIVVTAPPGVLESKLVSILWTEHKMQAILYGLQLAMERGDKVLPPTFVFNVGDGQMFKISGTIEGAQNLLDDVIRAKYNPRKQLTDVEFLERCGQTRAEAEHTFGL
ncbi:P-loop containing nucleoside triphosphate hydrolase protein [Mycena latifolia]|nr:P-loop containing nucleoside triphosphate hydrolase protein [Mycena latifolia]